MSVIFRKKKSKVFDKLKVWKVAIQKESTLQVQFLRLDNINVYTMISTRSVVFIDNFTCLQGHNPIGCGVYAHKIGRDSSQYEVKDMD